jgi:hypothetical protein
MEMNEGKFFSSVKIKNNGDGLCWEVIKCVWTYEARTEGGVLQELYSKIKNTEIPW